MAARFPAPYISECRAEDPIMERVPMDRMGIGANDTGLPKGGINSGEMTLKHIGGSMGTGEK